MLQIAHRSLSSRGAVNKARGEGFTPGIVYGGSSLPQPIKISTKELVKAMHKKGFRSHVHTVNIDGKETNVLIRALDLHPVSDQPMHIDFLRVVQGIRTTLAIPLKFADEEKSPGLKRGGVLNVVIKSLTISALAEEIPEAFTISLDGLRVGQSIHLEDIDIPEKIKVLRLNAKDTIATIIAPSGTAENDGENAEAQGG